MERCQRGTLFLDIYKQPFRLLLPDGNDAYKSFLGAVLSIITLLTLLSYASYKFNDLVNYADYKVQVADKENYYTDTDFFTFEDGYIFAAGLTAYDGKGDKIEDESLATLKLYHKVWNASDPNVSFDFHEVPSRFCTQEDMNLDGNNDTYGFFEHSSVTTQEVLNYAPRLKCFQDPSVVRLAGNFDSGAASNFMMVVETCRNETAKPKGFECKSPEEISKFLTSKYILMVQNQRKFIQHRFDGNRVTEESNLRWFLVNPRARTDFVLKMQRTGIGMND